MRLYQTILVAAICLGAGNAHAGIVIDDFNNFATPITSPAKALSWGGGWEIDADRYDPDPVTYPGQGTYLETGLPNVLGGSRYSEVYNQVSATNANIEVDNGGFDTSAGPSTWLIAILTYDANGSGLNLNATHGTKITVTETSADFYAGGKDTVYSVTLVDGSDAADTVSKTFSSLVNNPSMPADHDFLFSSYTGLDLTDIDKIIVTLETSYAQDSSFGSIHSDVPEPATLSLLALGGLALLRRRRK